MVELSNPHEIHINDSINTYHHLPLFILNILSIYSNYGECNIHM
jgi:hypothetical protein